MEIQIDIKLWQSTKLTLKEFILILLIYNKNWKDIQYIIDSEIDTLELLYGLEEKNYIRLNENIEDIIITSKSKSIFKKKSNINFDEFWDNFPSKTPKGRALRPSNKEWNGELTKDYIEAKKKYLNAVKTLEIHNKIINILKAKNNKASIEDKCFENNILTYINQRKWQKDSKYLEEKSWTTIMK